MMKKLSIDTRVGIYGSSKEIETAQQVIASMLPELPQMDEPKARLALQQVIDDKRLKASILINGNSVYSYERIIRDIKKVVKQGMPAMTDYLYQFLHLSCGSIAHYNKMGWIETYPSIESLKQFFRNNEFGHRVLTHLPQWKTDVRRIVVEIERILEI